MPSRALFNRLAPILGVCVLVAALVSCGPPANPPKARRTTVVVYDARTNTEIGRFEGAKLVSETRPTSIKVLRGWTTVAVYPLPGSYAVYTEEWR